MRVLALRGLSGSGKTETALALIGELRRRGYSVAAAKDTRHEGVAVDTPGKDSWRLGEASGLAAVLRAPEETALIFRRRLSLVEIAEHLEADFLVVEAFRDARCSNIVCGNDASELADQIDDLTIAVSGKAADSLTTYADLPAVSALDDPAPLADIVEAKALPLPPHDNTEAEAR